MLLTKYHGRWRKLCCNTVGSGSTKKQRSLLQSVSQRQLLPHSVAYQSSLPSHARVVICGAGVIGNSISFHLIQKGWTDVLVLDQASIGNGTSWHGSGIVGQFKPSRESYLVSYSAELYKKLQAEGHQLGWKQCGSLNVARTRDRMISLKRFVTSCRAEGLKCELVDRAGLTELHPHLYTGDLEGGVWIPSDGVVNSRDVCLTLAKLAKQGGAEYIENCKVNRFITAKGKVCAVETTMGSVTCDYVVNSTGLVIILLANLVTQVFKFSCRFFFPLGTILFLHPNWLY